MIRLCARGGIVPRIALVCVLLFLQLLHDHAALAAGASQSSKQQMTRKGTLTSQKERGRKGGAASPLSALQQERERKETAAMATTSAAGDASSSSFSSPSFSIAGDDGNKNSNNNNNNNNDNDDDPLLLRHPRGACGRNWQPRYARLHARIRQENKGRFMFHQCDEGQADCFAGMVSAFYLSVISKRAFLTGKYSYQYFYGGRSSGHLSAAFEQPYIDWDLPPDLFREKFHGSAHVMLQGMHASALPRSKVREIYETAMGDDETVTIFSNAGILHHLFEIPGFRARMEQRLGVSFEDAFGCALDFLFWPKNEFKYALKNEEVLRSTVARGDPVIGLHLRSGDAVFKTGKSVSDDVEGVRRAFQGAIACVEDLQKHVVFQRGVPAVLFVLSDDMFVRRSMAEIFPEYVVVYNDIVKPEHTGPFQSSGISTRGLQTAAIEFWMFGASDYQITSRSSGFGRAAAVRTLPSKPMHVYVFEDYAKPQHCGPTDQVSFQDLAQLLPGL